MNTETNVKEKKQTKAGPLIKPQTKVGNRPINMHIDQTSGHYWFKPVITGRLVVNWSIEKTWLMWKYLALFIPRFTELYKD